MKNQQIIEAFLMDGNEKNKNLKCENGILYSYNTIICKKIDNQTIEIQYPRHSRTTQKIINMLPNVRVNIKQGHLFLNDESWDGQPKLINSLEIFN
jgi:AAA15 family ATPase/GTPase